MTKCTEKEIKITKSCSQGKKKKIWSLAAKFKYFCVPNIQYMYFLLFFFSSIWFLWNLINESLCILKPLGVKKTQEICSMVTESLIIGPKRLLPGLGGIIRFRIPKVVVGGNQVLFCSLWFLRGDSDLPWPLIFAVFRFWSMFLR